jgi:RNA polymerase sigma-70 factor (ECF subfamily)
VARSTAGEQIDFESLYRRSRDDVYAYVAGMVRDRGAAEEVTAVAFERALTRRSSYVAARGSPRAWLFGIARNAAYDELRRRGRTEPVAEPEERDAPAGDATADVALRRAALSAALATLSQDERELVALKFEAGLANAEIGTVLGISETNVGTRLSRVVAKLRTAMG